MLDQSDAPAGFLAVEATMLCGGCKLFRKNKCLTMPEAKCTRSEREDGKLVIFKKA